MAKDITNNHFNDDDEDFEFEQDEKTPLDYVTHDPQKEDALDVPAAAEADKEKKKNSPLKFLPYALLGLVVIVGGIWFAMSQGSRDTAQKKEISVSKPAVSDNADKSSETLSKVMQSQTNANVNPSAGANSAAAGNVGASPPAPPPAGYPSDAVYNPYDNPRPPAPIIPNAAETSGTAANQRGAVSSDARRAASKPLIVESDKDATAIDSAQGVTRAVAAASSPAPNAQRSLYFYAANTSGSNPATFERIPFIKPAQAEIPEIPFGTMLAVRTLGAVHTLNSDGLVRFELTQDVKFNDYTLPRGTVFVGRNSGGANNRVFVSLIGWIENNRLISLGGDVMHVDGSPGLEGETKTIGSRTGKLFSKGFEMFSSLGIEYLRTRAQRQGTANTNIYGAMNPNIDEFARAAKNADAKKFVFVKAGTDAYVFVNDLPPSVNRQKNAQFQPSNGISGFDAELLKAVESGSDEEIQKILNRQPK